MPSSSVTHTLALEHQELAITPGGYDDWMKIRAEKVAQLTSQKAKQDKDKEHLQAFVDRFKAKASKARQAQSRVKMLEKMQDIAIPIAERTTPFNFPAPKGKLKRIQLVSVVVSPTALKKHTFGRMPQLCGKR